MLATQIGHKYTSVGPIGMEARRRPLKSRVEIKGPNADTIAFIDTDDSGKRTVLDRNMNVVGYYDSNTNRILDVDAKEVATSHLWRTLLQLKLN